MGPIDHICLMLIFQNAYGTGSSSPSTRSIPPTEYDASYPGDDHAATASTEMYTTWQIPSYEHTINHSASGSAHGVAEPGSFSQWHSAPASIIALSGLSPGDSQAVVDFAALLADKTVTANGRLSRFLDASERVAALEAEGKEIPTPTKVGKSWTTEARGDNERAFKEGRSQYIAIRRNAKRASDD